MIPVSADCRCRERVIHQAPDRLQALEQDGGRVGGQGLTASRTMRRYGQHLEVLAIILADVVRTGERLSTELCLTSWRLSLALLKS